MNGQVVESNPSVEFQAALNPVLLGAVWLAVPFAIVRAVRMGDRLAQWGLIWIAANYLPYVVLVVVSHRITYFYYVLPIVPALAALTALLLLRSRLPAFVTLGLPRGAHRRVRRLLPVPPGSLTDVDIGRSGSSPTGAAG